jgi:hypothetical protein
MFSIVKLSITFASLVFLLYACGFISTPEEQVQVSQIKYSDYTGNCDSTYSNNCAQIKIEFPQIENLSDTSIQNKINESIRDLFLQSVFEDGIYESAERLIKDYLNEYNSFRKDFPNAFQQWSLERIGEVMLNKNNVFSVEFSEYSYLGGAHPNTYVSFVNFDLRSGEEIKLNNLFKDNSENELNKIAETEFRLLKELGKNEDLAQAGYWFEENKFKLNDNFLITDSSLIFYYNNYEITAYAFGPTELVIPYTEINHLIGKDGLLSELTR